MKLSEFVEVYFSDKQNELKERTMKNKRYMMEQHIIPYFGDCMMSEVSAGDYTVAERNAEERVFGKLFENDTKSINEPVYPCVTHLRFAGKSM